MIGAIIGAIIGGLIIGALARLVLPGKQNISIVMTIVIGIVASLLASLVVGLIGYRNASGFAWIPFIVGIIFAAVIIVIYGNMTGRKQVAR
ncbi:GlsB/YeaQ/YmgE family stress response membrane protein [Flexivirga meconopsidis]|uniref:GlsB/YeaQ/YmgE family stress response membrane protein n=1 Tax=Flexivirga meconopsidis TaxID=2977121 RepID=UPI002240D775|nr:GlsB/YeaQ/YmgE family stress response membrane protein [Flexivirga meconopsidis]